MQFPKHQFRFTLVLLASVFLFASARAQQLNYQGVARKPDGTPMANQTFTVKLSIPGTSFAEIHPVTTNAFGLYTIAVGSRTPPPAFALVDWSTPKSLSVEINSTLIGTSDLNYVPYAIYANQLKNFSLSSTAPSSGQVLKWNGTAWAPGTDNSGSVTATPPITATTVAGVTTVAMPAANASTDGYLSKVDWSTFNGKESGIATGTTAQYWRGDKSWQTLISDAVPEGSSNLYFTDNRSRAALSAVAPITYNSASGQMSLSQANSTTDGYLSKVDWSTFNGKEPNITIGTIAQYWRGDKSWQTLISDAVAEGSSNLYFTETRSRAALSALAPITYNSASGLMSLSQANSSTNGFLSFGDWNLFNGKQNAISLTTMGNSGPSTFNSSTATLNIPTYTLTGLGGISLTNLSSTSPIIYNNAIGAFSISKADASTDGFLSKADWSTFNNKQATLTAGTGVAISSNTISIDQSVALTASPTFAGATLSGLSTAGIVTNNASGVLGTIGTTGAGDVVRANSPTLTGAITSSGSIAITNTSTSTSSTTGALVVSGGVGIDENLNVNGNVKVGGNVGLNWDNANKYLGIGTNSPVAPLHISSSIPMSFPFSSSSRGYFIGSAGGSLNYNGWNALGNLSNYELSIYSAGSIVSNGEILSTNVLVSSDERLKNMISVSKTGADLNTLQKIQITDYRYKDYIQKGNQTVKKVIAQQVESVYPNAVSKTVNFIPNVYALSKRFLFQKDTANLTLDKVPDLVPGDRLKLFNDRDEESIGRVVAVNGNSVTLLGLDQSKFTDRVFVYGKEVNDFRVVDYDALSMLNVSATQELAKRSEAQAKEIEQLKKEKEEQEIRINRIEEELKKLLKKKR